MFNCCNLKVCYLTPNSTVYLLIVHISFNRRKYENVEKTTKPIYIPHKLHNVWLFQVYLAHKHELNSLTLTVICIDFIGWYKSR